MAATVASLKGTVLGPDALAADPAESARGAELREQPQSRLFRAVWRWHFYAGLLVIPIIVILSFSGIVYLFKPQIQNIFLGHLRSVRDPHTAIVSYDRQLAAVKAAVPDGTVSSVSPAPDGGRSTMFGVNTKSGRAWTVYVNPYTGKVLGHTDNANQVTQIAREVHSSLLTSRFWSYPGPFGPKGQGNKLMELAGSWMIVLIITGVYLWWPRGPKRSLRRALRPRLRSRSLRVRWRDVHAVTGVLFSFVFLFVIVSGMFWTGVWGQKYQQVATSLGASYPAVMTNGVPSRTLAQVAGGETVSWASGEVPVPPSAYAAGQSPKAGQAQLAGLRWNPASGAPLDAIVARTQELHMARGYTISFPFGKTGSYAVSRSPDSDVLPDQSALGERSLFIDQYTAKPVGDVRFAQYGVLAQATDLAISLHEGRQLGLVSQLMTLVATLMLLVSAATAVVMWRKRRPKGIGAPRRAPNRKLGAGVVAITLGLGVFFPLLGLSIVALLVFDFVIVKRIPPLRRALGAT